MADPLITEGLRKFAASAAKEYGVPESLLIGVLTHESGFDASKAQDASFGNGGGLGQFTTDTAAAYGTTQDELRKEPAKAIALAARLLSDNAKTLGGDYQKAAAAYFIGAGNVQAAVRQGGADWLQAADQIAEQYGQGTVSDYIKSVGAPAGGSRPSQIGGNGTTPGGSSPTAGQYKEPAINDFPIYKQDPTTGEVRIAGYDVAKFNDALYQYKQMQAGQDPTQKHQTLADYLNTVIGQIGNEIEAGNMDVSKASGEFKRRMDAFDSAGKQFTSMLGYAVPLGSKTIPTTNYDISGPGQQIEFNPFQQAADIVRGTPDLTSIKTPDVSLQRALGLAQQLYGASTANTAAQFAGVGAGGAPPPSAPGTPSVVNQHLSTGQTASFMTPSPPPSPPPAPPMTDEERQRQAYLQAQQFAGAGVGGDNGGGSW